MNPRIQSRLAELRQEYETGKAQLAASESRTEQLRMTLERIRGAIQVLEELAAEGE
ncbi:hypothetical protein [Ramlibacter sp. WS9]|uniref:hypothetical protein n=1 Tax=Ramlibacter sp. WS9 TaxID=1882741 RepID=UPI0018EEA8DF|nr:hypothetical protein [Ramlibacter sp. WS9]